MLMTSPKKPGNPIDKHVGARVRMRRMMLSLSQEKLADGLHLTFQQVQKYEKGANRIGASRLQQIATILQVSVAWFFEGAPGQQAHAEGATAESPAFVNDFLATNDGIEIARNFPKIKDAKLRRTIVEMVVHLADKSEAEGA